MPLQRVPFILWYHFIDVHPHIPQKNDILLKSAFEETFPEFLRFYIPESETFFDIEEGFEFLNKELLEITPKLKIAGGTRFADLLVM